MYAPREAFALAASMMDRFENVKGRASTMDELHMIAKLAAATLAPDNAYPVHNSIEVMIDVLEALDFALYSETCCTILQRDYWRDPKTLDYACVREAMKIGGGDSYKAAVVYMWMEILAPQAASSHTQ